MKNGVPIDNYNAKLNFRLELRNIADSNERKKQWQRKLIHTNTSIDCDSNASSNPLWRRYFNGIQSIYNSEKTFRNPNMIDGTCVPLHKSCGWPSGTQNTAQKLPLYVLSVGLEGSGHHLWTEILDQPIFDCVWINGRHYNRDIGDGVPRTTPQELLNGFKEQFQLRKSGGKAPCKSIYDAEDSFPTGAIRKTGRVFLRPDLINLQALDGVLFHIKYLVIIRNTTDTAMSALRRNFFSNIEMELRSVEHTLTYLESALRGIPCHKIFLAHYEHVLADPKSFFEPLSTFLELDSTAKELLKKRLSKNGKLPSRKAHKLNKYKDCQGVEDNTCFYRIQKLLDEFLIARNFMWPTFAANGFDLIL